MCVGIRLTVMCGVFVLGERLMGISTMARQRSENTNTINCEEKY